MIIDRNAWHYRVYKYWQDWGRGNTLAYRENLCHYVRVLLFWAPMTWLDQRYEAGMWGKRSLAGLAVLATVSYIAFWLTFAGVKYPVQFLMGLGSLLGAVLAIGIAYYGLKFALTHKLPELPTFGIPTTSRLIYAYGKAKKRRICPFIEFQN